MKKLRWAWDNFEEVILCVIICVIVCVSGLQVVSRYLFNNSLTWSEELCCYLFMWTGFLTISLSLKNHSIIVIDAFVPLLPKQIRKIIDLLVYLLCTAVFTILTCYAVGIVTGAVAQKSPAMGLPLALVYAGPLLGFALSAIRSLGRVTDAVRALVCKEAI